MDNITIEISMKIPRGFTANKTLEISLLNDDIEKFIKQQDQERGKLWNFKILDCEDINTEHLVNYDLKEIKEIAEYIYEHEDQKDMIIACMSEFTIGRGIELHEIQNKCRYVFDDYEDLGRQALELFEDVPEGLLKYIDYDKLGKDVTPGYILAKGRYKMYCFT